MNAVFRFTTSLAIIISTGLLSVAVHAAEPLNQPSRSYTYIFKGIATTDQQPCAGATIEVRVSSDMCSTLVRHTRTQADGHYEIAIQIAGKPDGALNWEISGVSPHFETVKEEGRQITTIDSQVEIDTLLVFAGS